MPLPDGGLAGLYCLLYSCMASLAHLAYLSRNAFRSAATHAANIDKIEVVLSKLNDDDAACIRAAKNALSSPEVRNQLAFIRSNYGFIPSLIESVEARNVQLADSLRHIDEVQGMLADVQGTVGEQLQKKLDAVLSKKCRTASFAPDLSSSWRERCAENRR